MRIIAEIFLKTSKEGGRENPIYNGYRPTFRVGADQSSDCVITIVDGNSIKPGATGKVEIKILHPSNIDAVIAGKSFGLTEGVKEVATGSITSIHKHSFKVGDIVLYNGNEAEIIELKKVFSIEKAKIKILNSDRIVETKVEQLKEQLSVYSDSKLIFLSIAAKIKAEIANQAMLAPLESI
jgi:hypothetical protein